MLKQILRMEKNMTYPVPPYLTPYISTGMFIVIAALTLGLRRALYRATWPEADRGRRFGACHCFSLDGSSWQRLLPSLGCIGRHQVPPQFSTAF
jgi:hypothetical protein